MALREIGARLTLEGQAAWKQGMTAARREMSNLKSELKAVSAEYADNANSAEALQKKQRILKDMQAQLAEEVRALELAQKDAVEIYGENSAAADKYTRELNNARAELSKLNREVNENAQYLAEAEESADGCATSIDQYGKKIKESDDGSRGLLGSLTQLVPGMGKLNVSALTTAGAIGAIVGVMSKAWTYMMNLEEETRELRTSLSKFQTSAINAGIAIDDALNEAILNAYLVTEDFDEAFEALSNLIQADFSGSDMLDILDELRGAVVAFPDTLKLESLADSLQETIASGSATGQFSELLSRLGFNVDDFNSTMKTLTTTAERQDYVFSTLSSSGLSDLWDSYEKANSAALALTAAEEEQQLAAARLASSAVPLKTWWTDFQTHLINMGTAVTSFGSGVYAYEWETGNNGFEAIDQLAAYGATFSDIKAMAQEAGISVSEAFDQFIASAEAAAEAAREQEEFAVAVQLSDEELEALDSSLEEIESAYSNLHSTVESAVTGFTDFSAALESQATTGEALLSGLESQIDMMQSYSENLIALQELGASESLLTYFSENFSTEHAAELQALLDSDSDMIDQIFAAWDEKDVTSAGLVESMAEVNPEIQDIMDDVDDTLSEAVEDWDKYSSAYSSGKNTGQGYVAGIRSQIDAAARAAAALNNAAHSSYVKADDAHSPSKRSEREAANTVAGWTETLRASIREFSAIGSAMADAVHVGYSGEDEVSADRALSTSSSVVNNSTANLTIPSINVYAAAGQNAEEIAKAVEREIYQNYKKASGVFK